MDRWIMDWLQGNHHSNSRQLTVSFFFLFQPSVGWAAALVLVNELSFSTKQLTTGAKKFDKKAGNLN